MLLRLLCIWCIIYGCHSNFADCKYNNCNLFRLIKFTLYFYFFHNRLRNNTLLGFKIYGIFRCTQQILKGHVSNLKFRNNVIISLLSDNRRLFFLFILCILHYNFGKGVKILIRFWKFLVDLYFKYGSWSFLR